MEGASLTPYEFTVTNNCKVEIDYQISLELLETDKDEFQLSSIKAVINDNIPKVLSDYKETEVTLQGAYESRTLGMGTLEASGKDGKSETNELRLWIDEDAPKGTINDSNNCWEWTTESDVNGVSVFRSYSYNDSGTVSVFMSRRGI